MAVLIFIVAALSAVCAAPPSQFRQLNPLDYYLDSPEEAYHQQEARRANASPNAPARLETLDPNSEFELIPEAQAQQPSQQTPVLPNIPGLVPGQRVSMVYIPISGTQSGTIKAYLPVVVVEDVHKVNAAYPGYPANPRPPGYPNMGFGGNAYNTGYGLVPRGAVYYQQPAQVFFQAAPSAVNFDQGQQDQAVQEDNPSAQNAEQKNASQVTIDSEGSTAEQNRNEKSSQ